MFQMKEQNKTPEEEPSGAEIGNLPNKEFKVMIIKMPYFLSIPSGPHIKKIK